MAACLVLVLALALLYLSSAAGRRSLADALERLVSSQIPGTMKIGTLERFGLFEPHLRDLRFLHPNGRTVLRLDRATVDVDLGYLLRGRLGFHHAETSGGELLLFTEPDGRTSLEATFDWPTPGSGNPKDGFHYQLRSMHVQHLTVVLQLAKEQFLRLRETRGFVAVTRENTAGVNVRLERLRGILDRKLLGAEVALEGADGEITGKQKQIVDLKLQLRIEQQKLFARLKVFDRDKTPVELVLDPEEGTGTTFAALGLKVGSWFTDAVNVEWK